MSKDWATRLIGGFEKIRKEMRKLWNDIEEELRLELENA